MQKSVLICDDDEGILDVTSFILQNNGYRVVSVINSLEALDKVQEMKPDLIILDLWMPGMNGEEIATALKGKSDTAGIPILIISASRDGKQIAERCGAEGFIEKPFDIKTLVNRVRTMLN